MLLHLLYVLGVVRVPMMILVVLSYVSTGRALALDAAEGQHEAYLKGLLHPGSGHGRATVLHRLKLASAAAAQRKTLRILADARK